MMMASMRIEVHVVLKDGKTECLGVGCIIIAYDVLDVLLLCHKRSFSSAVWLVVVGVKFASVSTMYVPLR